MCVRLSGSALASGSGGGGPAYAGGALTGVTCCSGAVASAIAFVPTATFIPAGRGGGAFLWPGGGDLSSIAVVSSANGGGGLALVAVGAFAGVEGSSGGGGSWSESLR